MSTTQCLEAAAPDPDLAALEARFGNGRTLERKAGRPGVIEYPGASPRIVKLWWPRTAFTSLSLRPGAGRRRDDFLDACSRFAELGIRAPVVEAQGRAGDALWVAYHRIPGRTLRELVSAGTPPEPEPVAAFIWRLHESGVYFRALNMGNIVQAPDQPLAVIDVGGARFSGSGLSVGRRARNLASFLTHGRDIVHLLDGFGHALVASYAARCGARGGVLRTCLARQVRLKIRSRNRRRRRRGAPPLAVTRAPRAW